MHFTVALSSVIFNDATARTREDITKRPERYDVILDVAANRSFSAMRRLLTPSGRLVVTGAAKGSMLAVMWRAIVPLVRKRFGNRWLVPFLANVTHEDLLVLKEFADSPYGAPAQPLWLGR